MANRITNEIFLNRLKSVNDSVLPLEEYKGSTVNILCKCLRCENIWSVRPANLLSGKGCPVCAREKVSKCHRLTQDQYEAKLKRTNPEVILLDKYEGTAKDHHFRCLRCGRTWIANAGTILEGHGCSVCRGGVRKTEEEFILQLKKVNPFIHPIGKYINARTKILCNCDKCNQSFSSTPDKLLQGAGCTNCDRRYKSSFPEQALFFYLSKLYPDATNRFCFPGSRFELDIFIPQLKTGIEYDGVYWHKAKYSYEKQKYDYCRKHDIKLLRIRESYDMLKDIADQIVVREKPLYSFKTLDKSIMSCMQFVGEHINVNTADDSADIKAQYYSILTRNSLQSVFPEIAKEWNWERNKGITPDQVSSGSNDKYWWICHKCGYEWSASVAGRTGRGRGCKQCAIQKAAERYTKKHNEYIRQLSVINPNLEVLQEYQTTHVPIMTRCKVCGHEWKAAPANLLRGRQCPKCSKRRAARKISETKKRNNAVRKQSRA